MPLVKEGDREVVEYALRQIIKDASTIFADAKDWDKIEPHLAMIRQNVALINALERQAFNETSERNLP